MTYHKLKVNRGFYNREHITDHRSSISTDIDLIQVRVFEISRYNKKENQINLESNDKLSSYYLTEFKFNFAMSFGHHCLSSQQQHLEHAHYSASLTRRFFNPSDPSPYFIRRIYPCLLAVVFSF